MAIDSVQTLVQLLDRYHLLEPLQYYELTQSLQANYNEPIPLSREMVQRGWLTPYQVNHIFQGKENQLTLGSYVLQEKITEGPMGDVFKARHMHMRRIVALQVIRPELLRHGNAVERFYTEVQAASQLTHPHLVGSFDAGPVGDTHFFAMEFVEGIDLERHIANEGPLSVIQACEFVRQAALGLQHAFQRGLRHHDVNPSNLLLTQSRGEGGAAGSSFGNMAWGQVKVRNLGLTIIRQPTKHTRLELGGRKGDNGFYSPDYIAPERDGGRQPGDIRSEVYSLGCTFYYLLTGQPPFPNGSVEDKLRRHREAEPTPIEELRPAVPVEVRSIVNRMMAKEPAQRYQTLAEVASALANLPAHALAATAAEGKAWEKRRAAQQRRSRRLIIVAGAGLLVGLVLFGMLLFNKLGAGSAPTTGADEKPVVRLVPAAKPAVGMHCGRGDGWPAEEAVSPGYAIRLVQGAPGGGWGAADPKTFCWYDGDKIRFSIQVPRDTRGELLVYFLDGDNLKRRQTVTVHSRPPQSKDIENFAGKGVELKFPINSQETRDGQVEVTVKNAQGSPNAVISRVEFYPLVNQDTPAPREPALVVQCGRTGNELDLMTKGYTYRRFDGRDHDGWGPPSVKSHAWVKDGKGEIKFQVLVPPGTNGKLKILCLNPDTDRKQQIFVDNQPIRTLTDFKDPKGVNVEYTLNAAQSKEGKVEVRIVNLNEGSNSAISTIEFWPQ